MFITLLLSLFFYCQIIQVNGVPNGAIALFRNNITSSSFTSGIVRVYLYRWGNICNDYSFGTYEADVICHQLGYTSGSYSRAGGSNFGTDYLSTRMCRLDCATSSYLSIAQCNYRTYVYYDPRFNDDAYDAVVFCYPTRIWNRMYWPPFPGMIRLQGGAYSNEGRVEIYCNGQWGTICDDGFDSNDANTICKQLGYDGYLGYNKFSLPGNSSQPIWSTDMSSVSGDVCFGTRNTCPVSSVSSCTHSQDVTVECGETSRLIRQTVTFSTCSTLIPSSPAVNGAIILFPYLSFYGIVRVYDNGWGNIYANNNSYGLTEADVICHQLGHNGASSYSRAGLASYGTDYLATKWDDIICDSSSYLSVSQCSHSPAFNSCCDDSFDATVSCYFAKIWNRLLFPGMIRLDEHTGNYTNQGRVEVYCNGRWGTICSSGFDSNDADTVCKQLGYDSYYRYNHLPLSHSGLPIWSSNMISSSGDTCFGTGNTCPLSPSLYNCTPSSVECREVSLSIMQEATRTSCSGLINTTVNQCMQSSCASISPSSSENVRHRSTSAREPDIYLYTSAAARTSTSVTSPSCTPSIVYSQSRNSYYDKNNCSPLHPAAIAGIVGGILGGSLCIPIYTICCIFLLIFCGQRYAKCKRTGWQSNTSMPQSADTVIRLPQYGHSVTLPSRSAYPENRPSPPSYANLSSDGILMSKQGGQLAVVKNCSTANAGVSNGGTSAQLRDIEPPRYNELYQNSFF